MSAKKSICLRFAVTAFLWILAISSPIELRACSCIMPPVCDPHFFHDSAFIGEVVSKDQSPRPRPVPQDSKTPLVMGGGSLIFRIRVIESFRGTQKVGDTVDVRTGIGGGDCGYHFEVGKRYLVDARDSEGTLFTGICSRTASLEGGQSDIGILRRIAAHQPLPDVVGELRQRSGPIGGIAVSLQLEGNATSSTVVTDSAGHFEFAGVPNGRYRLSLRLPDALSAESSNFGKVESAGLPPIVIDKSGDTVCRPEIFVGPSATISGIVLFPDGKKAEGWVNADIVTPDGKPWNTVLTSEPDARGSFQLAHLKPGRYQVQFTRKQGFVKSEPQIIELKDGERKTGILLVAK